MGSWSEPYLVLVFTIELLSDISSLQMTREPKEATKLYTEFVGWMMPRCATQMISVWQTYFLQFNHIQSTYRPLFVLPLQPGAIEYYPMLFNKNVACKEHGKVLLQWHALGADLEIDAANLLLKSVNAMNLKTTSALFDRRRIAKFKFM